jgi:hypothetical protein
MHLRLDNSAGACSQLSFFLYAFAYVYDTELDKAVRIYCSPFPVCYDMKCRAVTKVLRIDPGNVRIQNAARNDETSFLFIELLPSKHVLVDGSGLSCLYTYRC